MTARRLQPINFIEDQRSRLNDAGFTTESFKHDDVFTLRATNNNRTIHLYAHRNPDTGNWELGAASLHLAGSAPYWYDGYARIASLIDCEAAQ